MSSGPDSITEVRSLAEAMFDGVISNAEIDRLNGLIATDPVSLQTYVEMANLHADLLTRANFQTDRQTVLGTLRQFALACENQEARRRRRDLALVVVAGSLVCSFLGWLFFAEAFRPTPLGSVAHMTSDAQLGSGEFGLGEILRQGSQLAVTEGIVSFQLNQVLVDVLGPAEVKLLDESRIELKSGALSARVSSGGEGFTVLTPDAEVVDLGTEFFVEYLPEQGTEVSVRSGRARATLLDVQGQPKKVLDVTVGRAARFQSVGSVLEEVVYRPEQFERVDRARGTIRTISGQLRTLSESPSTLVSEQTTTLNHMLVIPERQHVVLKEDLIVETMTGRTVISAGTAVSSYLVHYDPTALATSAPRGAVTFFGKISAAIVSGNALNATDSIFGLPATIYETRPFRGLELNADEIRLSDNQETVSFSFGMESPNYLDQMRVLLIVSPATPESPVR